MFGFDQNLVQYLGAKCCLGHTFSAHRIVALLERTPFLLNKKYASLGAILP
jgi:hypothetical protein